MKHIIKIVFCDFDGVFTDNSVIVDSMGNESVICSRADGIGIHLLMNSGVHFVVCSSEKVPIAIHRANKIGFECFTSVRDKGKFVEEYLKKHKFSRENSAFIGNDINDLSGFNIVDYKIAVSDSYSDVLNVADYILKSKGGYGAVREACEHILAINKTNK